MIWAEIKRRIRGVIEDPNVRNNKLVRKHFGLKTACTALVLNTFDCLNNYNSNHYQKYIETFLNSLYKDMPCTVCERADDLESNSQIPVWVMWLQGVENAPDIVKVCIDSQRRYFPKEKFSYNIITEDNIKDFVNIPEVILSKYNSGLITRTHMSDIIRFLLLYEYGGIWIDATCYLTNSLQNEIFDMPFYSNHKITTTQNNNRLISKGRWTSYFIYTKKHSAIAKYMVDAFTYYWTKNNTLIDYWLVDYALNAACIYVPEIESNVSNVPLNNQRIFDLGRMLNSAHDQKSYLELCSECVLHKLTYKRQFVKYDLNNMLTTWGKLQEIYKNGDKQV